MPWQQQVADVGLELLPDGRPAYREVVFTVPRQSGKTTLVLSWEVQRAVGWVRTIDRLGTSPLFGKQLGPQRIVYSAQTGKDARDKLLDDQAPILEPRKRKLGIRGIKRQNGGEAIAWANGSRIVLLAGTEDSGHGKSVDLAVKDELFADTDLRRDQTLIPAMATRHYGQMLAASTAGTADSVAWNAQVERGRAAAAARQTTGIAYFEWSAPVDADPADPRTWWACMPALGRTITLPVVEHAYASMELDEFKRAWLNIPTASAASVIPAGVWALVNAPDVEAVANVFALDVNPERSAAAIAAAGEGPVLEVVEYRAGTAWLVERAAELHSTYGVPIALDANGPAGAFIDDLKKAGVPLVAAKPLDVVRATGKFYDVVVADDSPLRVRRSADLDAAVAGAAKRAAGDAFVWGRKSSHSDICPLVAATVALWALEHVEDEGEVNLW